MKYILILAALVSYSAFSSDFDHDKLEKIATMNCLEIAETRKFESARRIRLVNEFRIEADLDLFFEGDKKLIEYLEAGLCKTVLLGNETDVKLALQRFNEESEKQKRSKAKDLMDVAFEKYETELGTCIPPSEKVDVFGRRTGELMTLALGWNRNYKTCLLQYHAPNRLGLEKSLAQRTLYYLVELKGFEDPLLFSGEYKSWLGSDRCSDNYCLVGFGYNFAMGYLGFGASIHDPEKKLGKKLKKKDIKKITLVLTGDINGYASNSYYGINQRMYPFPNGKQITKVVYKND